MRLLLGATVLALAPLAAHALDEGACRVGSLGQVVGEASVVRGDASRAARPDAPVCPGDRIVTGARSVVELQFPDGTRITVGKDSEFAIQRWQERRLRRNDATFELVRGAFRAVTGGITTRRHRMEIRTPIATIGIRGTDFWGGLNITPGGALDVVMLSGKGVYVKNDAGQVELTEAGTGTTVLPGSLPSAAKTWSQEKVARARWRPLRPRARQWCSRSGTRTGCGSAAAPPPRPRGSAHPAA